MQNQAKLKYNFINMFKNQHEILKILRKEMETLKKGKFKFKSCKLNYFK